MATLAFGECRYEATDEDRLWLLRAVAREGRVHRQVAQTLVNGFAWGHARKPKSIPTLTWWVQAYAQPVNPRWFPDGKIFQRWHAKDPKKYPLGAAMRRRDIYSVETRFEKPIVEAVERALTEGPVDIPANATDYAAAWIDATRKGQTPLTAPKKGYNRLWTRAPEWDGYAVVS